jgi:hypothetical protein
VYYYAEYILPPDNDIVMRNKIKNKKRGGLPRQPSKAHYYDISGKNGIIVLRRSIIACNKNNQDEPPNADNRS